jgi:ComF family protein
VCGRCLTHPPHYDRTVAAWRYAYPADRMLQALKYGARLALAGFCAENIAQASTQASNQNIQSKPLEADLIVPMPLHPRRLAERGFNQALEIARPLARSLGIAIDAHAVQRVRDTAAQAGLPFSERVKNVRSAFACERNLDGLRVAVVDDVMTTGATLNELAKTLKRAGASHVENWVVARTLAGES